MNREKMFRLFLVFVCCFIRETYAGPVTYPSCQLTYKCVLLKDCQSYMVFIQSLEKPLKPPVVKFLREKQCGFHDGYPQVCCPDSSTDNSDIAPMPKNNTCNGEHECLLLKSCNPFMDLIGTMKKPLEPEFVKFLRSQQCGFEEGYPMVCCSTPPEAFKVSKQVRPNSPHNSDSNKLSTIDFQDDAPSKVESQAKPSRSNRKLKRIIEAINNRLDMESFLDLTSPFDFF